MPKFYSEKIQVSKCTCGEFASRKLFQENKPALFLCEKCYKNFAKTFEITEKQSGDYEIKLKNRHEKNGVTLFKTSSIAELPPSPDGFFSYERWKDFGAKWLLKNNISKEVMSQISARAEMIILFGSYVDYENSWGENLKIWTWKNPSYPEILITNKKDMPLYLLNEHNRPCFFFDKDSWFTKQERKSEIYELENNNA